MAEIKIQAKKRPVWPWILLILILIAAAVLLYFYMNRNNINRNDNNAVPTDTTSYQGDTLNQGGALTQTPGDNVEQFQQYVEDDTAGFNKEYISNGLNMLAGAVHDVIYKGDSERTKISTRADSLTSYTQNLTDTTAVNFSRQVGKSFSAAYDVINGLQQEKFSDLNSQIMQLQSVMKSFNPSKSVETQEKCIRDFFRMSASLLSNMKNTARAI